jgi:hypothetical protein
MLTDSERLGKKFFTYSMFKTLKLLSETLNVAFGASWSLI